MSFSFEFDPDLCALQCKFVENINIWRSMEVAEMEILQLLILFPFIPFVVFSNFESNYAATMTLSSFA